MTVTLTHATEVIDDKIAPDPYFAWVPAGPYGANGRRSFAKVPGGSVAKTSST